MISPVESYILTCDNCQQHFENGQGFGIFSDENEMVEDSYGRGWHEKDGKHYCDECAKLDEEVDDLLIIDKTRLDKYKR